jgi:hypothetical protein
VRVQSESQQEHQGHRTHAFVAVANETKRNESVSRSVGPVLFSIDMICINRRYFTFLLHTKLLSVSSL